MLYLVLIISFSSIYHINAAPPFGQLSVKGNKLLGSNGQPAQLAGMSLFWSNCDEGKIFYNEETLRQLKCAWNANAVRAAMGVESTGCQKPGYLDLPNVERDKVEAVVQAAIKLDMYAVVDYHTEKAQDSLDKAKEFFTYFASKYGNYSNIIYEPFNEPTCDWKTAKAYHEQIVATIRQYDKNNMITLGTSTWSQDVDIASRDPVNGANLCYTLHVYAATHKQNIRDKAQTALDNNVCIFVSEYGTVGATGGGGMDTASMNEWWTFWDKNKISYLNWAISNKGEGSAALNPNTVASDVGNPDHWSADGKFVQSHLKNMDNGVSCDGNKGKYPSGDNVITTTKSPSKNKYPSGDDIPSTKSPNNDNYPSGNNIILTTKSPSTGNNNNGKYPSAPSNNNSNGKYPSGDQVITTKSPKNNKGKNTSAPSNNNNNGKYPSGENVILTTKSPSNNNKYPSGPSNNNNKYPSGDQVTTTQSPLNNNNGNSSNDSDGQYSISLTVEDNGSWVSGANFRLVFKNNGNVKACALKFDLILNSGQTIQSIWNVQKISGDTYVLPDYVIIQGGNSFTEAGLVVSGPATLPQIKVLGQGECKY
ncbi:unnamed protein product [Meloidogyne enterolobii]|uniref:Uncharacterized protein n=1 Tax=Meloidogyne enterolobii TaxID=390850 RepID=A0ACB0Y6E1_MELEN